MKTPNSCTRSETLAWMLLTIRRSQDVSPQKLWNKLKHTSWTRGSSWLYSTWTYLGIRHYFLSLRQGSHAAWKQMGAIVAMTDTAPAEAWNIQPDLGKNIPVHFQEVNLLGKRLHSASRAPWAACFHNPKLYICCYYYFGPGLLQHDPVIHLPTHPD